MSYISDSLDGRGEHLPFTSSEDGRTLSVKRTTPNGPEVATVHWTVDPTPEQIYRTIDRISTMRTLERGESLRVKKIFGLWVIVNTGPPTWWLPRLNVSFDEGWAVYFGWLNGAVSIGRPKP